jgi:SSS family solute:Na+ symporter
MQGILKTLGLASEIMTEGLFVPGIAMIFMRKRYPSAGFLSLCLGGGYSVIGFLNQIDLLHWGWPEWPFSIPYGLALCISGFLLGLLIDTRLRKVT